MAEYTPFGLAVKTKLLAPPRTQEWLVSEINKDTGMNVDSAYVSKILKGVCGHGSGYHPVHPYLVE